MKERILSTRLVIFAVLFLGFCIVFPVWQSSVSTSLTLKINSLNSSIVAMKAQTTEVKAQIYDLTNSSSIVRVASNQGNSVVASNI